ncbi:MAG: transposase [Bacteroidetes bacterium]|nr:transposase [Bacteroidota bacterium]
MQPTKSKKNISVKELLSVIPDDKISNLAVSTHVDYCTKVLYGRSMFYMILYSLLESERTSLRTMEDIFNSVKFKFLFNLDQNKTVRYSSISERLSVMDVSFFEELFEHFYNQLSKLYSQQELDKYNLVRVDSTMVTETSAKLAKGMSLKHKNNDKKQAKFTVAFDGILPCNVETFFDQSLLNECLTIPQVIKDHALKHKQQIYVFDRGVNKRSVFDDFQGDNIDFVTRLNPGVSYQSVEVLEQGNRLIGDLKLLKDEIVYLYNWVNNRKTKELTKETFRLITTENKNGETLIFLTNLKKEKAENITALYRKRWDVEVFFRFIKQELNFSHFMSTNENGIKIILYMTLILSMLLLIYKRLNNIGYKTAKRRFAIEQDELIIAMIVRFCGGDPSLVFR